METPEQARERLDAAGLRPDERVRLWQRIEQDVERRTRPRTWMLTAPIAAAAVVALVVWLAVDAGTPDDNAAPVASTPPAPSCELDGSAGRIALPSSCKAREVVVEDDEWRLEGGTEVQRTAMGARVVRGKVRFRVQHRKQGERFDVGVSHGHVRVVGTEFTIVQHEQRGSVTVSEGVVEFAWNDGFRERVQPGETLHWPRPEPEEREATEAQPNPSTARAPKRQAEPEVEVDADEVIGRLLQLRSQHRHGEAVELLSATLDAPGLSAVQRERISYELGLSLEAAARPACTHWRRHVGRFGTRLHEVELTERLQRCKD